MEEEINVRKVPIRQEGYKSPDLHQHKWSVGLPKIEGVREIREDTCTKCGCIRRMILRVGMHPWSDGYIMNGIKANKSTKCKK